MPNEKPVLLAAVLLFFLMACAVVWRTNRLTTPTGLPIEQIRANPGQWNKKYVKITGFIGITSSSPQFILTGISPAGEIGSVGIAFAPQVSDVQWQDQVEMTGTYDAKKNTLYLTDYKVLKRLPLKN